LPPEASNLNDHESAIESYTNAAAMVPSAWQIRNDLAESMIALGIYADAVTVLDSSLEITGDSTHSTVALYLKGRALEMLGQRSDALATLNQGLSLDYTSSSAQSSLDLIREIDVSSNVEQILIRYDRIIDGNPQDAVAYYFRGLAHLERGDSNAAKLDIEKSFGLGLKLTETSANRAYAKFQDGHRAGQTKGDLVKAASAAPDNALFNAYLGEYRIEDGEYLMGLEHMARATMLDENLGMALLGSSRAYMLQIGEHQTLSSGTIELMELAKEFLDSAIDLDLPTPSHYVERGIIHAFFSEFELAYSDFEKAIEINPDLADTYFARAKTTANRGDFQLALVDLNTAIQLNPENGAYFRHRYVVYQLLGDLDLSETDFATLRGLGWGGTRLNNRGVPSLRDTSYFSKYQIPKLTLEESDIATYRSVLELIPNDWQIRNNLAEELIELGNYNQAMISLLE